MESWIEITPEGEIINNIIVGDKIQLRYGLRLLGVESMVKVFHDELYGQIVIGNLIWYHDTSIDSINGDLLELIFKKV